MAVRATALRVLLALLLAPVLVVEVVLVRSQAIVALVALVAFPVAAEEVAGRLMRASHPVTVATARVAKSG